MRHGSGGLIRTIARIAFGGFLVASFLMLVLWRTENPRLVKLRADVVDLLGPSLSTLSGPMAGVAGFFRDVEELRALQAENRRLRAEVARLRDWRGLAHQLARENDRLRALVALRPPPRVAFVTAEIIGDAGGPFAESVLVNVGARDGVRDGAPALDSAGASGVAGLVGRTIGVGDRTARLLLVTDPGSRIPVRVGDARAILQGARARRPQLLYATAPVRIGDEVVTSGDGDVFPAGLHVGRVALVRGETVEIALGVDFRNLRFVRLVRADLTETAPPDPGLVAPEPDGASNQDDPAAVDASRRAARTDSDAGAPAQGRTP